MSYDHDTRGEFYGSFEMEIYTPNVKDYPLFFQGNVLDNVKSGTVTFEFKDKEGNKHTLKGKILPTSASIQQMGRDNERTGFSFQYSGLGELKSD